MNWMIKDSRGQPSTVLTFVVLGVLSVIGKFWLGGHFGEAPMSGVDFAAAFGSVVGVWTIHENNKRKQENVQN